MSKKNKYNNTESVEEAIKEDSVIEEEKSIDDFPKEEPVVQQEEQPKEQEVKNTKTNEITKLENKLKSLSTALDSTNNATRRALISDQIRSIKEKIQELSTEIPELTITERTDDTKLSETFAKSKNSVISRGMVLDNRSSIVLGIGQ